MLKKGQFLKEGDVIIIKEGMEVFANIPEHFVYPDKRGSFRLIRAGIKLVKQFDYLFGLYIVYKTVKDGGGRGGYGWSDVYPSRHHVFCVKHDNHDIKIDFYQESSYRNVMDVIELVGNAHLMWTINENGKNGIGG